MADIDITPTSVLIRFTRSEKLLGLLGDLDFPLHAVTAVAVEEDGLRAVKGVRAPGLALPGRRKIGTWRGRGRRSAVSVRAGEPAVRITLTGQRFDQLVLGHPDAAARAEKLDAGRLGSGAGESR